jgi:hypothetical protein
MSVKTVTEKTLSTQGTILRTLAYFDVFRHPLRKQELARFGPASPSFAELLGSALNALVREGMVQEYDGYYGLQDVRTSVMERERSEVRAVARMPKALTMSRRIARTPFVRAVFISGSMSKGRAAPDGDIDYFIITAPGRLWVARTLLVLYKRLFLFNSRKDFCVNYFLDTEHLTVEDRNRFTATEVVTLLPTYGNGTTEAFFARNAWAFKMFPGALPAQSAEVRIGNGNWKNRVERWLSGPFGDQLDSWCMDLTWRRWRRKFSHLDARTFELALRTRTYVSKHHPRNFQEFVMRGYKERVFDLEKKLGRQLS